ncbi:hypothetical protein [Yersinia enterocolitica]|uniref:hypothetical protein n=1 Tax=Yersinia enterocolitica TaxID=630 RepID=UPI003D074F79
MTFVCSSWLLSFGGCPSLCEFYRGKGKGATDQGRKQGAACGVYPTLFFERGWCYTQPTAEDAGREITHRASKQNAHTATRRNGVASL